MEKVKKAQELIDQCNTESELTQLKIRTQKDIELNTIINCLLDDEFKNAMMKRKSKEDFYNHQSESIYVEKYASSKDWFLVFCRPSIRNIQLLLKSQQNPEWAKELVQKIKSSKSKTDYLFELYCEDILKDKISARYQLGLETTSKLFTSEENSLDDDLITFNGVDFDNKQLLSFFEINNEQYIRPIFTVPIKQHLYKKISILHQDFVGSNEELNPELISTWVTKFCPQLFFLEFLYYYKKDDLIHFKILNSIEKAIKSELSLHLEDIQEKKDKLKKVALDGSWSLIKAVSGVSAIEEVTKIILSAKELKDGIEAIDQFKEYSELLGDTIGFVSRQDLISKVQILKEEFDNSSFPDFKTFFIKYFETAIKRLFRTWNIEVPSANLMPAYDYFMNQLIMQNVTLNDISKEQAQEVADPDLFYIDLLLNNKINAVFNSLD